ncbi:hypothetical protein HQO27_15875 [Rhodococcus fascians]|nr:hypothetical protein [Rhodococcus fascians]
MKTKNLLVRIGIGSAIAAAAMVTTPALASADPITDFLCGAGSAGCRRVEVVTQDGDAQRVHVQT